MWGARMTDTPQPDRREKPHWTLVWTNKLAPAFAGAFVERVFTNERVAPASELFKISTNDIRSYLIFGFILALTDPMYCVNLMCAAIETIRVFFVTVFYKIWSACTKPIDKS